MEDQVIRQATLVEMRTADPSQDIEQIALFLPDGRGLVLPPPLMPMPVGDDIVLTGYVGLAGGGSPVAAEDTVNEGMAKLQAQIATLTARVDALETAVTALQEGPA